ncbi:MAG: ATP-binding protein [Chloroflexota bacterium]
MITISDLEAQLSQPGLPDSDRRYVLNQLAWALRRQDPARALDLAQQAYALAVDADDQAGVAHSYAVQAAIYHRRGAIDEALRLIKQAVTSAQAIDEQLAESRALHTLGWIQRGKGVMDEALDCFVRSLDLARAAGDRGDEASALSSIGVYYGMTGNSVRSQEAFERAMAVAEAMGDERQVCHLLNNLAALKGQDGDAIAAASLAQRCVDLARRIDYTYGEYTGLLNVAVNRNWLKQHESALEALQAALAIIEAGDFTSDRAYVMVEIGNTLEGLGRYADAEAKLREGLALAQESDEKPMIQAAHESLITVCRAQGRLAQALDSAQALIAVNAALHSEQSEERLKELEVRYRTRQAEADARYQQQLREQEQQQFRTLMRTKDDLLAMATHDMKSPLSVIMTNVHMLARSLPQDERIQRYLRRISAQTLFISNLISDMLDLAYLEGWQHPQKTEMALVPFIRQLTETFSDPCADAGVTLSVEAAVEDVTLEINQGQFNRLFNNLISNAIKHTPAGGRITIMVSAVRDAVEIAVRDTGTGIQPEDLPHIFERFYRGQSDRDHDEGSTGLGLAIVKAVVDHHGGVISVESVYGDGTTFRMRFPLKVASKAAAADS